tara:strand:+ start:467 stop:574 length:108 start_codon:yes stop_codon:yes gene_type:complete
MFSVELKLFIILDIVDALAKLLIKKKNKNRKILII